MCWGLPYFYGYCQFSRGSRKLNYCNCPALRLKKYCFYAVNYIFSLTIIMVILYHTSKIQKLFLITVVFNYLPYLWGFRQNCNHITAMGQNVVNNFKHLLYKLYAYKPHTPQTPLKINANALKNIRMCL